MRGLGCFCPRGIGCPRYRKDTIEEIEKAMKQYNKYTSISNPDGSTSTWQTPKPCTHCSGNNTEVYHTGPCPKIKSIEYYENGAIKRIEYNNP